MKVDRLLYKKIEKFGKRYLTARPVLKQWYKQMREGNFGSIVDLRETFSQTDPVPVQTGKFTQIGERTTLTVFNIGNNIRLIAFIGYKKQRVFIRHVLTHNEYMNGKWKR